MLGSIIYILLLSHVNRMATNKCFIINTIMFNIVFARCSNRGSAHYFLYRYLNRAN